MSKFSLVLAVLLVFSGCGGSETSSETTSSSSGTTIVAGSSNPTKNLKYWGEWKSFNTGQSRYITTADDISVEEIEENVIKIGDDYFLRSGTRYVNFEGSLYREAGDRATQGYENIGSIEVILRNLRDSNIESKVETDESGNFVDNSLPAGDYNLQVSDGDRVAEATVTLVKESEELGNFKLVPKGIANFKVDFMSEKTFIYANGEIYNGNLIVENTGEDMGLGLNFTVSIDGAKSLEKEIKLGSIPIGESIEIPLKMSFNEQFENRKTYNMVVDITDAKSRKWRDTFPIEVYKGDFALTIKSQKNMKGLIKLPDWRTISVDTDDQTIYLPLQNPDEKYTLLFTNYSSLDSETIYGIGVESNFAKSTFDTFENTTAYEPNDEVGTGSTFTLNRSALSYLHFNDVDYWEISTEEDLKKSFSELFGRETSDKEVTVNLVIGNSTAKFLNIRQDFSRSGDIVTDNISGLLWEDQSTIFEGNLKSATNYCENLSLSGKSDWRLPTLKELWYLHDRTISNPALKTDFQNTENGTYWTNQEVTQVGYENRNWSVSTASGNNVWTNISDSAFTRCVRGESAYEDISFQRDNEKEVVIDSTHGLMWQNGSNSDTYTNSEAISYCNNLSFSGYSDWRLPTISELYSITDQRKSSGPFVNNQFRNIQSSRYWSSSISIYYSSASWIVDFDDGSGHWGDQARDNFAVCVRNF
ncbi:Protein of unknown function (DUF1566) [Thiovulum sp. ES]|nr:Protein of unknown function (DUF1566) [Thiovulum sp. ES]